MRLVSASTEVNTGIEKSVSHGEVLQTDISVFFPDNELNWPIVMPARA
jgi:hypothetical protein